VTALRPALVCRALLDALDASDGRRRRRKRDTTADAIGMAIKRQLLTEASEADPEPDAFEAWLFERCRTYAASASMGAMRAMAGDVLAEWRLAAACPDFRLWLAAGARSQDRDTPDERFSPRETGSVGERSQEVEGRQRSPLVRAGCGRRASPPNPGAASAR
jgi:hypothetical protein